MRVSTSLVQRVSGCIDSGTPDYLFALSVNLSYHWFDLMVLDVKSPIYWFSLALYRQMEAM